jgi:WD40 repeat protein
LRQSFSSTNFVEEWDTAAGRLHQGYHPRSFLALARDARALAIHDRDERGNSTIRLLDVARDAWTLSLPAGLSEAEFSPDGRHLVAQGSTGGGRGSVLILADAAEGRVMAQMPFGERWWFSPSGKRVAVHGLQDRTPALRVFDLGNGRQVGELKGVVPDLSNSLNSLEIFYSPNEEQVALLIAQRPPDRNREEGFCSTWTISRNETTRIDSRWMGKIGAAAFTRAGTRLVLNGQKEMPGQPFMQTNALEVWDITGGQSPRRLVAADGLDYLARLNRAFLLDADSGRVMAPLSFTAERPYPSFVIWDAITGREVQRLRGRVEGVTGEGRILLLRSYPERGSVHRLMRWAGDGETIEIESLTEPFVGTDGRTVVGETYDQKQSLCLWDLGTGRPRRVLEGQAAVLAPRRDSGGDPVISPDGRSLVTQSTHGPGALNLVELLTGKVVRSIPIPRPPAPGSRDRPVLDASFDKEGLRLAFNVSDRYRILDLESGRILDFDRPGHRGAVRSVDIGRDGGLVVSGSDDGTINLWEATTGRLLATVEEGSVPIREVALSPAGDRLAARDADGRLRVWTIDRSTREAGTTIVSSLIWTETATAVAFSADGTLLAAGRGDGTIGLLGASDGRLVRILSPGPDAGAVGALAADSDGSMLASGSDDGSVRLWDMTRGALVARCAVGPAAIRAVAFGKGGLVGISARGVEVWDKQRGERLVNLEQHSRAVNTLSFSPDGRVFATGSDDQSVTLWRVDAYHDQLIKLHLGW